MGRPNKRNQHQYQHQTHKPRGTPERKLGRGLASSQDRSGSVQKAVTRRSMWSGAVHYSGTAYRSVRNEIFGATHYTLHVLGMPFRLIIKPVTWTITSFKRAGDIEHQLEGNYDACTQDLTRSQKEKTLQHEVDRLRKALSNEKEKFQKKLQAIEKNHAAEIESRCRENRRIEDEYDDLQRNYQEVVTNSRNFQRVQTDYQELERDYQRRESDYRDLQGRHRRETDGLQRRYDDMRRKLEAERKANEELSNRLSKALSDKLTDNNPNIADLSDENRPTKLAEKLSELYDNEWTNAYSVLEERYQEFEAISILLNILQDCCSQCRQQARDQLEAAKYKFKNFSPADQKHFKDERKRNVHMTLPFVTQLLKISIENKLRPQFAPDLLINSDIQEYIQRCAELCWLMAVQDPPMAITKDVPRTLIHNKSYFKEYTKYGKYVDYVVWPAILIQDGGALMAKGIVQCCDRFEDSKLRD